MLKIISLCLLMFCSTCFAQSNSEQDYYLAKKAFADGFYEISLKHFQKYLEGNPESPDKEETRIFIARCYLNLEKQASGLRTLEEVLQRVSKKDKLYPEAIYWLAQTYFTAKDYESALGYFQKIVEQYPDFELLPQSYYYRASCYYNRKQFNQALQFYKEFNKRFTKHQLEEESSFRIAQCFYNIKDYPGGHKEFERFIKEFPNSAHRNAAYYYLGEIEYFRGNFNQAVQYYTEASEEQPKSKTASFAKYARGWAYLKLEKYKQARDEFNNLEEMPEFGKSLVDSIIFAQGRCLSKLQSYARAIQKYERIIDEFSHSVWFDDAYFWKGEALYELGKFDQACQIYAEAIEKFSRREKRDSAETPALAMYERENLSVSLLDNLRYNLGWTYARMKRYAQAIEQFEKVFEDSQERFLKSGALSRIGDIYLEQGKNKEAITYYDSVLKDFAGSYYADYAQYQLGLAVSGEKRFESAILAFRALIANFPQSKFVEQAHYQIGAIYFRQGRFGEASRQLENLIKEFPKSQINDQAIFLRACADYNNRDYARALDGFRDVLRVSSEIKQKMKAQYQIGFCLYQMGKEEKGVSEFKKFLSRYPRAELAGDVLFWLGQYYYRQNDFPQAQEYFAKLQETLPHNELADDALFWRAKALFAQHKLKPALECLRVLEMNYPSSDLKAEALLLQGDIVKEQGDFGAARDLYQKVCREFKESSLARLAHKKTAEMLQEQNSFRTAIEEYRQALESSSKDLNAQIQFAIAQCWEAERDYSQAVNEYLKVCYLYPQASPWPRKARLKCGQLFEKQAQWEKAKAIYEKLAGGEDSAEAELARKRLEQLNKQQ